MGGGVVISSPAQSLRTGQFVAGANGGGGLFVLPWETQGMNVLLHRQKRRSRGWTMRRSYGGAAGGGEEKAKRRRV